MLEFFRRMPRQQRIIVVMIYAVIVGALLALAGTYLIVSTTPTC